MLKPLTFLTLFTTTITAGLMIEEKLWFRDYEITTREFEGKNYKLIVADTDQKRQQGLMYRPYLLGYDGMEFRFSDSKPRSFWNKNTWMDLQLVFLNQQENLQEKQLLKKVNDSIITYTSDQSTKTILELK